jgi:hypothetical protein
VITVYEWMAKRRFSALICQKRGSRAALAIAQRLSWRGSRRYYVLWLGAIVGLVPITSLGGHVRLTRHDRLLSTANSTMAGAYTRLGQGKRHISTLKATSKAVFFFSILVTSRHALSLNCPCFIHGQRSAQSRDCRLMEPARRNKRRTKHFYPQ